MKRISTFFPVVFLFFLNGFAQQKPSYKITDDAVIVYPNEKLSGNAKAVQLLVMTDNIIRVTASPEKNITERKSLVVTQTPAHIKWQSKEVDGKLVLTTAAIKATINLSSAAISFTDLNDNPILSEREITGRNIAPVVLEGEPLYSIKQTFETVADDFRNGSLLSNCPLFS